MFQNSFAISAMLAVALSAMPILASDHIDGDITKTEPLADLSDFYAFPSNGGQAVSLILNTYPIAHAAAHFSSRISYAFELRSAQSSYGRFRTGAALRITCRFDDEHDAAHSMTCQTDTGEGATVRQDQVGAEGPMRLYFGRRSDPFFFNSDWATATSTEGVLAVSDGENTISSLNVLSLAVQIDRAILPGDGMLALAVEAFTQDGGQRRQLDRIGRPEITNVTLIHRGDSRDIRDLVNAQPAFDMADPAVQQMQNRLGEAIRYYDALDGQQDWSADQASELVAILRDDFLVLDPRKPCDGDDFFEIERAVLNVGQHVTCGGRKPTDDIIDRLYTLYVTNDRKIIGDSVDAPFKPISPDFPHLAKPQSGVWAWFKTWLGNRRAR